MKTKLTLNIDEEVIKKAKKISAGKRRSLSSFVEEYLFAFSNGSVNKSRNKQKKTITDRIRKFTKPLNLSEAQLEKQKAEYLESKYGK